jgi:Cu+-exporting ATPase
MNGILISGGDSLETAHKIDTIVLDKTGTLTKGKPAVTDLIAADTMLGSMDDQSLLLYAASAERSSEHPLAEALVSKAKEQSLELMDSEDFSAVAGHGISARVGGRDILIGNEKLMRDNDIDVSVFKERAERLSEAGKTPVYIAIEGTLSGLVAIADTLKDGSVDAIRAIKALGVDVVMITGDNKRTAEAVASELDIGRVLSEVLPGDKAREIKKLQEEGRVVAMVGDGINDAPALAGADVGIAMGTGTDVAMEASDITLIGGELRSIVTAIALSRACIRRRGWEVLRTG